MEETLYDLYQEDKIILTATESDIRERIEELLEEKLGFFISLQESTEDDRYEFYAHSDNDLSYAEVYRLYSRYRIDLDDDYGTESKIKQILSIDIKESTGSF